MSTFNLVLQRQRIGNLDAPRPTDDQSASVTLHVGSSPWPAVITGITGDCTLFTNRRLLYVADHVPDGIKIDINGVIDTGCADGVHAIDPYRLPPR